MNRPPSVAREPQISGATILLRLDRDVPADVRSEIRSAVAANKLEVVDLS